MSGPPQLIFDDGSRIMAEAEEVEVEEQQEGTNSKDVSSATPTLRGTIPLDTYYEINRISYEIIQKLIVNVDSSSDLSSSGRQGDGYDNVKQQVIKESEAPIDDAYGNGPKILRIALQFPDELLIDSPDVCWLLEDQIKLDLLKLDLDTTNSNSNPINGNILPFCFVLGDTTVNSCCPDEVAAYHLNATILIHYGHACLSPTSNLPIIYSFGKRLFHIHNAIIEFENERLRLRFQKSNESDSKKKNEKGSNNNKFLILYQVGYHHAMKELQDQWTLKVNEGANADDSNGENSFLVVSAEIPVPSQQKQSQLQRKRLMKKKKSSSSCCSSIRQQSDAATTSTPVTATTTCCQQSDTTDTTTATATTIITNDGDDDDDDDDDGGGGCCGNNNSTNNNACNRSSDDDPLLDVSVPENDNENESEDNSDDNNLDNEGSASSSSSVPSSLVLGGLVLPSKHFQTWNQLQDYTIIFIMANPSKDMDYCLDDITTPQQRQYANTMLCLLSLPNSSDNISHWIYSPETETAAIEETEVVDNKKPSQSSLMTNIQPSTSIQRQLNRRYYLIQKAKDSQTFGILVSNLSQQYLVDVVKSIQHLLKNNDKSSYTFAVGKINPNKLANFAEIDMFVLVACQENSLLDKERNEYGATPVITPYELQISLGIKEWGGGSNSSTNNSSCEQQEQEIYSLNCQDIIVNNNNDNGGGGGGSNEQQHQDDNVNSNGDDDDHINDDSDAPYFSMITGKYVSSSNKSTTTNLDLINLPGKGQVMEYNSTASEFLKKREYQGLKSNIGKTNIEIATKGLNGIASDYSSNSKYKYK